MPKPDERLERRGRRAIKSPGLDRGALDRYARGKVTLDDLAVELGYVTKSGNPATRRLRKALDDAGVPSPRGVNWSNRFGSDQQDVDPEALRQLYDRDGLTITEVANRLGWLTPAGRPAVTYTRSRLLAAGVSLRGRGPMRRHPELEGQVVLERAAAACAEAEAVVRHAQDAVQRSRQLRRALNPGRASALR